MRNQVHTKLADFSRIVLSGPVLFQREFTAAQPRIRFQILRRGALRGSILRQRLARKVHVARRQRLTNLINDYRNRRAGKIEAQHHNKQNFRQHTLLTSISFGQHTGLFRVKHLGIRNNRYPNDMTPAPWRLQPGHSKAKMLFPDSCICFVPAQAFRLPGQTKKDECRSSARSRIDDWCQKSDTTLSNGLRITQNL